MQLLRLIWEHSPNRPRLLWLVGLTGFFNYFILDALLSVIRQQPTEGAVFHLIVVFILGVLLRIHFMQRMAERVLDGLGELLFAKLDRVAALIRSADLATFERVSKPHVLSGVTRDLTILTEAFVMVPARIDALMRLLIGIVILGFLSEVVCAATLVMVVVIFLFFYGQQARAGAATTAHGQDDDFRLFSDLLHGHHAVKLNARRGDELLAHIAESSGRIIEEGTTASRSSVNRRLFIDLMMFGLLGLNLFVVPFVNPWHLEVVVQVNMVLLWMLGLLMSLASGFVELARSEAALARFAERERELDGCQPRTAPEANECSGWLPDAFDRLSLRQVAFTYWNESKREMFTVGPIDLELEAGETLVFTGGNGAGKSTLVQLIAGLYEPEFGELRVDDREITPLFRQSHRNLFAFVGPELQIVNDRDIDEAAARRLNELLKKLKLDHKCGFAPGRFTGTGFSKGERQRLALALALVRDRPVCVFDEWTADQSPEFRRWFYAEFIPGLQRQGRTILIVSHDIEARDLEARMIRMEHGRLVEDGS